MQLPPPLPEREPVPFPLAAALVPLLAGVILFAVTRSPLTLVLAAMGPVAALAGMLDGARRRRRSHRRAVARRRRAVDLLSRRLEEELASRRAEVLAGAPSAAEIVAGRPAGERLVLGFGDVPTGIRLQPVEPEDEPIAQAAAFLPGCPITAAPTDRIGLAGRPLLTRAVRRALEIQCRNRPPAVDEAPDPGALPAGCAVVLRIDGVGRAAVLAWPGGGVAPPRLRPELLSGAAVRSPEALPPVRLAALGLPAVSGSGLPARFLTTGDGALDVDLVRDGPHAVVGGTTGSGKSELLVAWMTALARAHPPERLALLLIDFKGGTAFDPLAALPHTAGVVTDLDRAALSRLATGLRAELVRREQALRDAGARSIEGTSALPRLVVVVDEFAALLSGSPGLADVFTDAAARGRALGVHLVLCTQRPVGAMRESLLANCALRFGLRMLSPEDSRALLGTADAATLPASAPGCCVVARQGEPPVHCRVASAGPDDLPAAARGTRVDPVWLPPLPTTVPLAGLPAVGRGLLVLGLADQPERRRQIPALWHPANEGPLLVAGERGSGRSSALVALAAQTGAGLVGGGEPEGPEALWDGVASPPEGLLLVDDLDLALGALADEHRADLAERLARILRSGRLRCAATVQAPLAGWVRPLTASFPRILALRMPRDEHALLVRGAAPIHDPTVPPGAGWWGADRIQVAWARPEVVRIRPRIERVALTRPILVIERGNRTRPAAATTVVTPEEWRARPDLWPLAARLPMLLIGCTAADHRLVTGRRELPPPLAPLPGRAWLVRPGNAAVRADVTDDG